MASYMVRTGAVGAIPCGRPVPMVNGGMANNEWEEAQSNDWASSTI